MENTPIVNLMFSFHDKIINIQVSAKTRFNVVVEKFLSKVGINTDNKENIHILYKSKMIEATYNRTIEEICGTNAKQIRMDVIRDDEVIGA